MFSKHLSIASRLLNPLIAGDVDRFLLICDNIRDQWNI